MLLLRRRSLACRLRLRARRTRRCPAQKAAAVGRKARVCSAGTSRGARASAHTAIVAVRTLPPPAGLIVGLAAAAMATAAAIA